MTPRCDGCRYWHVLPHTMAIDQPGGECQRFPRWEYTGPKHWCGEFAAIPGPKIDQPILEAHL